MFFSIFLPSTPVCLYISLSAWVCPLPLPLLSLIFFLPASYFSWFIVRQGVSVRPRLPLWFCEGVLLFMAPAPINHVSQCWGKMTADGPMIQQTEAEEDRMKCRCFHRHLSYLTSVSPQFLLCYWRSSSPPAIIHTVFSPFFSLLLINTRGLSYFRLAPVYLISSCSWITVVTYESKICWNLAHLTQRICWQKKNSVFRLMKLINLDLADFTDNSALRHSTTSAGRPLTFDEMCALLAFPEQLPWFWSFRYFA